MELKNKFIIKKSDGSEVNPKAKYFVLRYDKYQSNMLFMLASKKAMVTFAEVIKNDFKELSCDLIKASTGKDYIDDEIAELKESNTWVSVDERLPKEHNEFYWYHGVRIFAELPTGQKLNIDAQWTKNKRFVHNGIDLTEYVTYWQPLPTPPQK